MTDRANMSGQGFATAVETAYPPLMCAMLAKCFHQQVLEAGVKDAPLSLMESVPSLARAASVAAGKTTSR